MLLQSQSEMQRVTKTKRCERCDGDSLTDLCWDYYGKYEVEDKNSVKVFGSYLYGGTATECLLKCREEGGATVGWYGQTSKCKCWKSLDDIDPTQIISSSMKMYQMTSTPCPTTSTTTTSPRRRRSCAADNACQATTSDPTCEGDGLNECSELSTAGTCCETCDTTGDSRRRDGRRRKGGYRCQRRRG